MITHADLTGIAEGVARRAIRAALSIAPCLNTLEGEERADALAIVQAAAEVGARRGSHMIRGQRVGPAGVDYNDATSWFFGQDRDSLRALCGVTAAGGSVGSFPAPSPVVHRLWPECATE